MARREVGHIAAAYRVFRPGCRRQPYQSALGGFRNESRNDSDYRPDCVLAWAEAAGSGAGAVNATFWNKIADRVINVELILAASSGVPNEIFVRD
jgi:hypothetical protein